MKICCTAEAKISSLCSVLFNPNAVDIREPFTDIIESLSRQHAKNIDWWESSPVSRKILPPFHYCCCIALLQNVIQRKQPILIITIVSKTLKKINRDLMKKMSFWNFTDENS